MANEWKDGLFVGIAEVVMGQSPPGEDCNDTGHGLPLLNGPTEFGSHHPAPVQFTTNAKKVCQPGDLLFCVRGSTTGRMNWADQKYAIGRGIAAIRHRGGPGLQPFLKASVDMSLPVLLAAATGSTFPNVSKGQIEEMKISIPPLPEQRAIAHVLGTLDDKIECNRRLNRTLEGIVRALFKSWFIDFDPVIDNALAAGNPIPDDLADRAALRQQAAEEHAKPLPDDLRALFPAEFIPTDEMGPACAGTAGRWIPKGWEVAPIGDLCLKVQNGGTPHRNTPDFWIPPTIPWLSSGEVRQSIITRTNEFISELGMQKSSAKWIPRGATVVALYGATAGQVAFVAAPITTNQAVCALIPKANQQYFNYLVLSHDIKALENLARGSAQQNISKGIVETMKTVKPLPDISRAFAAYCMPPFEKWISNLKLNERLSALRDALLPKLLSGEVSVPLAAMPIEEDGDGGARRQLQISARHHFDLGWKDKGE